MSSGVRLLRPHLDLPGLAAVVTVVLVVVVLVSAGSSGNVTSVLGAAYFILIAFTIRVMRSIRAEPGTWLGRRAVRRGLVVLIALICMDFAVSPASVSGATFLLFLLLVVCDFALARATGRLTSARDETVDERQEALRNRAFRLAYGIFASGVGATILISYVASVGTRTWLANAMGGAPLLAFLELLVFLPAMTLAWLEPDRLTDHGRPAHGISRRERLAFGLVGGCVAIPILLSLTIAVAPVGASASVRRESSAAGPPCVEVQGSKEVGFGYGATIPIHALACWDGTAASESWGLNASDCNPALTGFATVETTRCARTTDEDGTLHFVYAARVRSAVLPFVTREVSVSLVLTRNGRIEQFP